MTSNNQPYTCSLKVDDGDGEEISVFEIHYTDADDAMRAWGHACQAVNCLQRDIRKQKKLHHLENHQLH